MCAPCEKSKNTRTVSRVLASRICRVAWYTYRIHSVIHTNPALMYSDHIGDIHGAPSTIELEPWEPWDWVFFGHNNGSTFGDDGLLLDDTWWPFNPGYIGIVGLENGWYRVLTYVWEPGGWTEQGVTVLGSPDPTQIVGPAGWSGEYVLGDHYAEHIVEVTTGTIRIYFSDFTGYGGVNGIQLEKLCTLPEVYCSSSPNSVGLGGLLSGVFAAFAERRL